jgi:predicted RNA-binding protein with PIN domain
VKQIYWVDGYNLLFYLDETKNLERERETLLTTLKECVKQTELHLIIVFDGSKEFTKTHLEALEIIYTPPRCTADQFILEELESRSSKGAQFFVVTNDRHLGVSAKLLKARVLKVAQFLQLLVKKRAKKKEVPKMNSSKLTIKDREFERFLKIFEERYKSYESGELP